MKERLKRLPLVARIYRSLYPQYSTCGCCGLPWAVVKSHTVTMRECSDEQSGRGFFPVCEYCWQHKSQDEIDRAIVDLYFWWVRDCERAGVKVPYRLEDMLANAHEQKKEMKNEK